MSDASVISLRRGAPALSAWLAVFLWALAIAGTSTDAFGASNTRVWIGHVLRFLWPDVPEETVIVVHAIARKLAHFTEYAIFAVLLVRALRSGTGPTPRSPLAIAIGVAAALALADEGNQSLSTARTGALLDCVLDVAGACVGAVLVRSRWT
jgi:VanZ family protein